MHPNLGHASAGSRLCHLLFRGNCIGKQRCSILQKSLSVNRMATEQVFNEYPLNVDVALVVDPFFQRLLVVVECNGFINLLNLRLNLLNYNGFAMGHPLRQQRAPFLMTNAVERSILALGMGATGD